MKLGVVFSLYNDQTVACRDCGQEFTFTAGEQEFYAQRGFSTPTRCASCRAARKAARGDTGSAGGSSYGNGGGSSYGGSSYSSGGGSSYGSGGGYSSGGGYESRGPREMFSATCSSCGKEAKVPFQPSGARPVYCSDCFTSRR